MTKDEILNMPAGYEIDALIAEKVMGWKIETVANHFGGTMYMTEPNGCRHFFRFVRDDVTSGEYPFMPSTEIHSAWEVVKKLFPKHSNNEIYWEVAYNKWACSLGTITQYAETAPLAICRVALLSVMEEE